MRVERAEPDGKHGCLSAGRNPFGLRSHYGRWPWAMPGPGRRKFLNCDSGGATRRSRSRSFGAMRCACTGATSVARATDRRRELTDHHHFFLTAAGNEQADQAANGGLAELLQFRVHTSGAAPAQSLRSGAADPASAAPPPTTNKTRRERKLSGIL